MSSTPPGEAATGNGQGVDRAAAFAASRPGIPRRVVIIVVAVAAVLAIGGTLGEKLLSSAGLNPTAAPTSSTPSTVPHPPTHAPAGPQIGAPLPALMGIVHLAGAAAPAIMLVDQQGKLFSLAGEKGRVVVLTFFSADCTDICPVLAREIEAADADLGALAARVAFVTVNADPVVPDPASPPPALTRTGLDALGNWYFLSGLLPSLDSVWRDYGISVDVLTTTGTVAHNDLMYFVDPSGRLRLRAAPYAEESATGTFTASSALEQRWAFGISTYARQLMGAQR